MDDEGGYYDNGEEVAGNDPYDLDCQSCLHILLLALICITCPISLPLLALWCCFQNCTAETCLGMDGMDAALV